MLGVLAAVRPARVLLLVGLMFVAVGVPFATPRGHVSAATTIYVDDTGPSCPGTGSGTLADPYCTIQLGVNAASSGDTVSVAAGNYTDPIDVNAKTSITIAGAGSATVIVKPTSTLCWNVASYGCSRRAVLRIVNSTNISVSGITFDMDLVKANFIFGALMWDSTGSLASNVFKNNTVPDASGGYYEFGVYARAPGYSDASRANVAITGNTFTDVGRVAVLTHDYVQATIQGNTITKNLNDFGYGIEMGSQSTGTISSNTLSGFDTPALSDGSSSAGIYIENAFTGSCFGIGPHLNKPVVIANNDVYGNQFGMWIGNGYDCYAGDVDIQVNLSGNHVHNNTDGGILIEDEDASDGSSVTVIGDSNTVANNGPAGFYFNTYGDGELHASLTNGTISGNGAGILVEDNASGPSTSVYDLSANFNSITGNTIGINNTVSALFDGECNWWGANSGPGPVGPGTGDPVSSNVDYDPWLPSEGASCGPSGPPSVGGIAGLLLPAGDGATSQASAPVSGGSSKGVALGSGVAALILAAAVAVWYLRRRSSPLG